MAAKIRLTRVGGKNKAFFRIVVIDESKARDGRSIEVLGYYDPGKNPSVFEVNKEKVEAWMKKGAIPSDTVRKYLGKAGILPPVDYSKKKKKASKGESAADATAAEAK